MNTQPRHPKCRALPVEPHPVIHFSAIIPRRGGKSKIFLSVVIPVVKAAFVPFSATGEKPLLPVLQGFAAFRLALFRIPPRHSQTRPDTNFAIPGYSLFRHYTTSKKKIKVFSVRARSYGQTRFCAALSSQPTSRKRSRRKALRRFVLPSSGYRRGALKRSPLSIGLPLILRIRRPHAGGVSTIPVFSPACKGKMSLRLTAPELPSEHPRGRSSPKPRPDPRAPCGHKLPACGRWACADPAPE